MKTNYERAVEILRASGEFSLEEISSVLAVRRDLRDSFAMAALQGFLADPTPFEQLPKHESIAETYAEEAYTYADAMLAARCKTTH